MLLPIQECKFYRYLFLFVMFTYLTDVIPYYSAFFGRGSGPVLLELVQCVGTERNLTACSHDTEVICSHAQDAGVACLSESMFTIEFPCTRFFTCF